ncbi:MAG: creatininase family protein [Alphaproteobacteria bacterium]|nr:creatininase family protein [Alphaproteobacteria bacterium]
MSAAPQKHLLKDMTFVEFRQRIAREKPVILIPLGSQEEQGPNAPMGDWMLTEALADRIAAQAGAVAAPTIPFGYADYFRPVPGGIQFRAGTFRAVLRDVLDGFLDHGLDRLLVFNGHSGNHPLIDETLRIVRRERGVIVPWVNVWRMMTPEVWKAAHGEAGARSFGHGADPVSSVYMHLFPGLMRPDLAEKPNPGRRLLGLPTAGLGAVRMGALEVNVPINVTDHCDNGIASGHPAAANPAAGKVFADHVVATTVALVEHLKTIDPTAPGGGF